MHIAPNSAILLTRHTVLNYRPVWLYTIIQLFNPTDTQLHANVPANVHRYTHTEY